MQPTKFKSLISPPWPPTNDQDAEHDNFQPQCNQENLSNFERNEMTEGSLDNIAMLGYN